MTVSFNTSDHTAAAPEDYAATSKVVTFSPGTTTQTVPVPLAIDPYSAKSEDFYGNLSNPSGATIAVAQATGTITQGDPPELSINDVTGKENQQSFTFIVSLSQKSEQAVSVNYATQDVTAKAGEDYGAVSGTVTIPAGALSGTITVPIIDDGSKDDVPAKVTAIFGYYEPQTEFWVVLSNPQNATLGPNVGVGTIYDPNDPNAPVQNCTCSCGCGQVQAEPTNANGDNTMHMSPPIADGNADLSPDGEGGNTQLGFTYDDQKQPHPIVDQ
ncbi:MAG TPA: Calx-beta domain-containing protein, partial [Pirellulales bacterium]|nr:Calx-beta domain-containing protein [Pirellulales bacterium]